MSDLAKLIAEDTQDAPWFYLYGFQRWRGVIAALLDAGYSDALTEAIMRSDWPHVNRDDLLTHLQEMGMVPRSLEPKN